MKCPCHNCGDRCIDCHANCARYAEYRKALDEQTAATRKNATGFYDTYYVNKKLVENNFARRGKKQ